MLAKFPLISIKTCATYSASSFLLLIACNATDLFNDSWRQVGNNAFHRLRWMLLLKERCGESRSSRGSNWEVDTLPLS